VAQVPSFTSQAPPQAPVYGGAVQTPLLFEGETTPINQASLSIGASALYDDNVFERNILRVGDEAFSFNPSFDVTRQSDRLIASFDYMPFFVLYRQLSQFDKLNHATNLNLAYRLTSRIILGVHDTFSYVDGNYYPLFNQLPVLSGPPSPTALNQQILAYTTRILSNGAGLDLTFVKSRRTSIAVSGGYNVVKYGAQAAGQPLYNGSGYSGSVMLQYRGTEHTSLGILLLHQDNTYRGGQAFGARPRSQIESAFFSVGSRLSPSVSVTVFGGPQYVGTVGQVSAGTGVPAHVQGSGGGSITKQVQKTALDLSFQRSVSGSGGLYTSVISTNAAFAVRRRLARSWEADLNGGAAEQDASLFRLANGKTDGLFAGINISRPLPHGAVFHISYVTWHQLSKGTLPIYSNFDRNQVAVGINYQLKALPLGR
jgi:hypothetical protein